MLGVESSDDYNATKSSRRSGSKRLIQEIPDTLEANHTYAIYGGTLPEQIGNE